jgi:hypothetical protein
MIEPNKIYVGLDLSLNNSGIYLTYMDKSNQIHKYGQLIPTLDTQGKVNKDHKSGDVTTLRYDRKYDVHYEISEVVNVRNGRKQAISIVKYIMKHLGSVITPDSEIHIVCEAPPTRMNKFQTSSHFDLIKSNSIISDNVIAFFDGMLDTNKIKEFNFALIANSTIKKIANVKGRGAVVKELLIEAWQKTDAVHDMFDYSGKIDDIADAYFASQWYVLGLKPTPPKKKKPRKKKIKIEK